MNNLIKNKRADISIVLLVFMTLVVCGFALFMFLFANTSSEKKLSNVVLINEVYSDSNSFRYYLYTLAKETLSLNPSISEEKFISEFKRQYALSSRGEYLQEQYLGQINNNTYQISLENDLLKFRIKDFKFSKQYTVSSHQNIAYLSYTTDISFEIRLE